MRDRKRQRLLPHRGPGEREAVDLEIEHHLAEQVDRLVAEGWPRHEAEAEAKSRFGDRVSVRDEILSLHPPPGPVRKAGRGILGWLSELARDLRLGARTLARRPVFTATASLTLAVAIGGTATIFSVVHATLLRPLPFPDADRLMRTYVAIPGREPGTVQDITWSYPKFEWFRDQQRIFDALALFRATTFTVTGETDPERIDGEIVSAGYAELLGVEPVMGRTFLPSEDAEPGTHHVAMIGEGLWTRRFGADPRILGQTIRLQDRPYEIVGVLPQGFEGLTGGAEVWVPIMTLDVGDLTSPASHNKHALGRLRPGVTPQEAKEVVARLGRQVHEIYPGWGDDPDAWGAAGVMLTEERMDPAIRASVLFLFGAVALLLVIACVNVANLILARASTRTREVAVRKALGAGRARIVRQLLAENALVAVAGGLTGLLVAFFGVGVVRELAPVAARGDIFRGSLAGLTEMGLGSIRFDGWVILFAVGVGALSILLFGLVPALDGARGDLNRSLRDSGVGVSRSRARGFLSQRLLVTGELALTFALLVGAGLMLRTMSNLLADDGGFTSEGVLTARLALPRAHYDSTATLRFYRDLDDAVQAIPGVVLMGRNQCLPLSRSCQGTSVGFLDGAGAEVERVTIGIHWADGDYFRALRIPLVRGRLFDGGDRRGSPPVALVNEAAALRHWPAGGALGGRMSVNGDTVEVVGVVGNVRYETLEEEPEPQIYLSNTQTFRRSGSVVVRTELDPASLVPEVRSALRALDPDLPLTEVRTMAGLVSDVRSRPRFGTTLVTLFGALALLLAAIGIYGVVAFGVAQQTHEIGIRVAIGAERLDVLRMVLARGVFLAVSGIVLGTGLVVASVRVLRSIVFGVEPFDPLTMTLTATLLLSVATLASYVPARKAVSVDPLAALRAD